MSVVAVALVNLRVAARDAQQADRPAQQIVPRLWVRVLSIWRYKEVRPLTFREFTLALARLGGHLNRKSDGLPGSPAGFGERRVLSASRTGSSCERPCGRTSSAPSSGRRG
jgi:hypothetical protein